MTSERIESDEQIADTLLRGVIERLTQNRRIRQWLPGGGRLYIERQLPFLCVYRRPTLRPDLGTEKLMVSSASYLSASADKRQQRRLSLLVREVAGLLSLRFHGFLIVEIWSDPEELATPLTPTSQKPTFRIIAPKANPFPETVEVLERSLQEIRIRRRDATVAIDRQSKVHPPDLQPLISSTELRELNCCLLGLEVQPVYRRPGMGEILPLLLRQLDRGVDRALKKTYFTFSCSHTSHRPEYYFAVGRRALVKAVWEVDRQLAAVSDSVDLLLQVTPVNVEAAWKEFRRNHYEKKPRFQYRPLAVDPSLLKRQLFIAPIEEIEDATLSQLFHEKQDELDRQITLLADIGTRNFMHGSMQLYGGVEDSLLALAKNLLDQLPHDENEDHSRHMLDAEEMAQRARAEIEAYRAVHPDFWATAQVREDMYPGLMVSQGRLLIGAQTKIAARRVKALLSHEIGVHLVTYFNGLAQPIRQLHTGLPGYDELQEGLAVLSEYLVGGLSRSRLRMLGARVMATRMMTDGASFVETFRALRDDQGFPSRSAFTVTMRIYRGGGFTKDAVYLRGLAKILDYLHEGGELEPLFVGKISSAHVSMVQELQSRQVLRPIALRPHYFNDPAALRRLDRLRDGLSLLELVEKPPRP